MLNPVHNLDIHAHKLLAGTAQTVHCAGFDKMLDGPLVDFLIRHTGDEIFQIGVRSPRPALRDDRLDHRPAHALDGRQRIADLVAGHGKTALPLINVRRQDLDAHAAAGHDILRHLIRIVDHRSQKRRHEFHRMIVFQISRLICHHRIAGRVGFVKSILGEIHHRIVDMVGHLGADAVCHTPRHPFLRIAVGEVFAFLLHHILLLLTHGTAHQIAASHGVAAQILHDLHDLLLINNTAIRGGQNRLQLRAVIGDGLRIILALDIFRDKIHRARPVKGYSRDHVLQAARFQLLHKALHPAAFQLEHAVRPAGADGRKHRLIVIVDGVNVDEDARASLHHLHRVLDHRQSAQAKEIHLEQTQLLYGGHRKLGGYGTVGAPRKGYILVRRIGTDHHPRRMHGRMSWQPLQPSAHIDQRMHLFVFLIQFAQLRVHLQRLFDRHALILFIGDHLGDGIHEGIRQIHHAPHVTDHTLGRHRTECHDLHHPVLTVLTVDMIDHLLPSLEAKVHVDIRHRDTLRI